MGFSLLAFVALGACGDPCGPCGRGTSVCSTVGQVTRSYCDMPDEEPLTLIPAANTGARQVFSPESYSGSNASKIAQASAAAAAVDGAVVLDQMYEIDSSVMIYENVMYTGGGIARECVPAPTLTVALQATDTCVTVDSTEGVIGGINIITTGTSYFDVQGAVTFTTINETTMCAAGQLGFTAPIGARAVRVFNLFTLPDTIQDGIIIDSMVFDGRSDCNNYLHDWRYNNTFELRGQNIVRNSKFYRTPSENITSCGITIENVEAYDLSGSLTHKSCSTPATDVIRNTFVNRSNLAGDSVMEHSEGTVTFSNNSKGILVFDSVFMNGNEGVYGLADSADEGVYSFDSCFNNYPRVISMSSGANPDMFMDVSTDYENVTTYCTGAGCP